MKQPKTPSKCSNTGLPWPPSWNSLTPRNHSLSRLMPPAPDWGLCCPRWASQNVSVRLILQEADTSQDKLWLGHLQALGDKVSIGGVETPAGRNGWTHSMTTTWNTAVQQRGRGTPIKPGVLYCSQVSITYHPGSKNRLTNDLSRAHDPTEELPEDTIISSGTSRGISRGNRWGSSYLPPVPLAKSMSRGTIRVSVTNSLPGHTPPFPLTTWVSHTPSNS